MRPLLLAALTPFVLAACDSAEPPKPAVVSEIVKPPAQARPAAAPPAPAPVAAAQPSPDTALAARITRALRDSTAVAGQGVDATVDGGVVTLYGTVPSAGERARIRDFVAGMEGVGGVVDRLVVIQGS
ncbi:MAG TPA: BON domain-containing protein [Burkholderiales bacterium]|nr:BON domain-containing protein [Burkholderiales bacterium]